MTATTKAEPGELAQLRIRVRLLKEMATQINSGLNVEQLVSRIILEAHKSLPEYRISYATVTGHSLRIVASVAPLNMPTIEGRGFEIKGLEELAAGRSLDRPMAITDLLGEPRLKPLHDFAQTTHTRGLLVTAVARQQNTLSLLALASRDPHEWSSYEQDMLADMAEHLAISIREAQMQSEREEIERQLRESQKMEAVGRLVGGVAHDFNNLLTGMMIYTGLLSTALGPQNPLQRHVSEIQAAGQRGALLVGQLLSLSRKHVLETRILSLNDIVSGMREMLQRVVGEEVLIECHLAGDLPQSRLDENQLRQALLNLAINARDAMKSGGRLVFSTESVTVGPHFARTVAGLAAGGYAMLRVQDTGEGMSAEVQAHCFEPFYTTKPTGEGTGLGLAAVYGMVQQHGGGITVESAPGQGTSFSLYFPVADGGEDSGLRHEGGRDSLTVLLVEDEGMLRLPLTERLKAEGYQVLSAATPQAALDASGRLSGGIDLLVTDLVMPGMCGEELARRLEPDQPYMRVLFMSGYTDDPRARRLISSGANFLRKPFDSARFVHKIKELVERGGVGHGQQQGPQEKIISSLGKET